MSSSGRCVHAASFDSVLCFDCVLTWPRRDALTPEQVALAWLRSAPRVANTMTSSSGGCSGATSSTVLDHCAPLPSPPTQKDELVSSRLASPARTPSLPAVQVHTLLEGLEKAAPPCLHSASHSSLTFCAYFCPPLPPARPAQVHTLLEGLQDFSAPLCRNPLPPTPAYPASTTAI